LLKNKTESRTFYFLRLANLPTNGILTVDAHFKGLPFANLLNILSICTFFSLLLILSVKKITSKKTTS
jgi:hypothetical protein